MLHTFLLHHIFIYILINNSIISSATILKYLICYMVDNMCIFISGMIIIICLGKIMK